MDRMMIQYRNEIITDRVESANEHAIADESGVSSASKGPPAHVSLLFELFRPIIKSTIVKGYIHSPTLLSLALMCEPPQMSLTTPWISSPLPKNIN